MTDHLALSERAFLIAWSTSKGKMIGKSEHKHLVSAAVLVELWLAGQLQEQKRKPVAQRRSGHTPSPLQSVVLERIRASRPRSWKHWVKKDARNTLLRVQNDLEDRGLITVEKRSVLGIPLRAVTVRDTRAVRELIDRCRRAALGSDAMKRIDPLDGALTAMVSAVELNTVFTGRERRANRGRIAELAERSGPATKALRGVVTDNQSSAAAG